MPGSLSATADRLGFVTGPVREVLRAAALLGVDFAVADLAVVLHRSVADLIPAVDEACAAGVLAESGRGLGFRHPLIRAALYDDMAASVRLPGTVMRDALAEGCANGPGGPSPFGPSPAPAPRPSRWTSGCWTGWRAPLTCWSARHPG